MANLPFWLNKGDSQRLNAVFNEFWSELQAKITLLDRSTDALSVGTEILDLLAWERDITRIPGEDLCQYRNRIDWAWDFVESAGEPKGFESIWQKLGLGSINQEERYDATEWDAIKLEMTDAIYSQYQSIIMEIIRQYGRTCRQYIIETKAENKLAIHHNCVMFDNQYITAKG